MKLLLDTHVWMWALDGGGQLSDSVKKMLLEPSNEIYYSMISVLEVQLKHSAHPEVPLTPAADLIAYSQEAGYHRLNISVEHILGLDSISLQEGAKPHKDPYDRLLISQAKTENMLLITYDKLLKGYGEACVLCLG